MIKGIKLTPEERKVYKMQATVQVLRGSNPEWVDIPSIYLKDGFAEFKLIDGAYYLITPINMTVTFRGHRRKKRDYTEWPAVINYYRFYRGDQETIYEEAIKTVQHIPHQDRSFGFEYQVPIVIDYKSPKGKARYARLSLEDDFMVLVSSEGTVK